MTVAEIKEYIDRQFELAQAFKTDKNKIVKLETCLIRVRYMVKEKENDRQKQTKNYTHSLSRY